LMKIIVDGKKQSVKIGKEKTVSDVASQLNVLLQNYLVKKNDEIVPDTEIVTDKDNIEFLKVVSGG
jgi:sulfur carrier protein ThiS